MKIDVLKPSPREILRALQLDPQTELVNRFRLRPENGGEVHVLQFGHPGATTFVLWEEALHSVSTLSRWEFFGLLAEYYGFDRSVWRRKRIMIETPPQHGNGH